MASVQSPPRARTQDVLQAYDLLLGESDKSPGKSPTKVSGIEDPSSSDQNAGILTPAGAYFAVVVAAFGGVSVKTGRRTMARMHPWSILVLVVPLFVIQITMIVALVLDMDVTQGVWDLSEENEKRRTRLVVLKCLMIFVVNMVCFGHMLSNIRFIAFITNPITWLEIRHPSAKQWLAERDVYHDEVVEDINLKWRMDNLSWLYHPFILWLACIISLSMRYCVSYFVMVNSMSIIFASTDMTAAIFNSLALTFVNELNTIYWDFLTSILNLEKLEDLNSMKERTATVDKLNAIRKQFPGCWPWSDYTSRVARTTEVIEEARLDGREVRCACFVAHILYLCPYLSRGNGYRRFENFLGFLMMGLIYLQQVYIMCFALMTNVLPVARDICTMWRWSAGRAHVWKRLAPILIRFLDFVTLVHLDLDGEVKDMPRGACRKVGDHDKDGNVLDAAGMYYRMLHSDRATIMFGGHREYIFVNATLDTDGKYILDSAHTPGSPFKSAFWFGFVCLCLMVIVPQFSALRDRCRALCGSGTKVSSNDVIAPQKSSADMTSTDVIALQTAFKDLERLFLAQSLSVNQLTERVKELESKAAKK